MVAQHPDAAFREGLERFERLVVRHRWRSFHADALAASYTGSELLRRRLLLRLTRVSAAPDLVGRHRALTAACLRHDTRDRLSDIRCPTLVQAGDRDRIVRVGRARELAAGIPNARLQVFEGLRHGFPEQAPGRTYEAILGLFTNDQEALG